jgi:hypothetical protein
MTVIAWDGTSLAADRRACGNGQVFSTTKIHRVGDVFVGVAGYGDKIQEFVAWIMGGRQASTYPDNEDAHSFVALVIETGGRILQYERTAYPIIVEEVRHAIGSGRDFALMAMHLGKTAAEACELAAQFDEGCGNGVDVLTFGPVTE